MDLQTKISQAGQLFKMYASRLEKLNIHILEDFLFHIPFRYEDYSLVTPIEKIQSGEVITVQGEITDIKNEFTKSWKKLQKAKVADATGQLDIIWFNQPYITKILRKGAHVSLSGRVGEFIHKTVLESPEYELITQKNADPNAEIRTIHTGRLVPIYPETKGVSSKWIRRQVYSLLQKHKQFILEYIPSSIIDKHNFMPIQEAISQIHFPDSYDKVQKARERLAFDELFLLHLSSIQRRIEWEQTLQGIGLKIEAHSNKIQSFYKSLPFELTNAQKKAIADIFADMQQEKPMNRLLEGDVGSGKTVVAAAAMYVAYLNGYQSVLMAPTEILAQQHHATISKLLSHLRVNVGLQTGSSKYYVASSKNKKEKKHDTGYMLPATDILVGTHALLVSHIELKKLGLVVIDEQQRFGVEQRAIMRKKGKNPHVLTMTATPIPRTVALTVYGDLDLSYLDEMPKGRKIIKTWLVPEEKRQGGYEWIEKNIAEQKTQVFIICPFIEESENMTTVKAAAKEFERLQKEIFPNLKLGLLHGRLKSKEKDAVLQDFRDKKFDILVATPVVEVGIDIPTATIMVIEASERFGLAQLHQLRGRVGRGDEQSYCLLFTESTSPQTFSRLKAMERMYNGAELAEYDLHLRGAGDLYGTAQHGAKQLKIASFSDLPLIEKARNEAKALFKELNKYPALKEKLKTITVKTISPD